MFGADHENTMTLAAAVELLHTATLVHDDLIDGALLRRGNPTLNAQWSPAATILTGDFIFARAAKLAAETDSIEVMNLFAQTLSTIVNGEITQMFNSRGLASREDYFDRTYAKTASMFELAAKAPVYLSDTDTDALAAMRRYGYEVGMAFQIVDDILDFTSDQADVGKPVASDLRQGLITLPALCYMEKNPDNPDIKIAIEKGEQDKDGLDRLVEAIRKSGAIEQAMNEARKFVDRGLSALENMPSGPEHQALEELANYVVSREI
jgi:geranylgeranyl pyrophosphate synthase